MRDWIEGWFRHWILKGGKIDSSHKSWKLRNLRELNLDFFLAHTGVLPFEVEVLAVIEGDEDESTSETTEDIGTSTLVERLHTFVLHNLVETINGRSVLTGVSRTGDHHHTTTNSIKRIREETSSDSDGITDSEATKEAS
jgi:hypothetical protein